MQNTGRPAHIYIRALTGCALAVFLALIGCAITPPVRPSGGNSDFAPLQAMFVEQQVTDARFQPIEGTDYFAVDLPLRYRMEGYASLNGLDSKRKFVRERLGEAREVAVRALALHLERVPAEGLARFRQQHLPAAADNAEILAVYRHQSQHALEAESVKVMALSSEDAVDAYWTDLQAHVQESILTKGRVLRQVATAPAVPFIRGWIAYHEATDPRGPMPLDFRHSEIYRPQAATAPPEGIAPRDWMLLNRFAPGIVHEINPIAAYLIDDDRFGEVALQGGDLATAMPSVDATRPTVYVYVDRKTIHGVEVRQLVYTLWHPEHPRLSRFDPEAGILDGWTVRITLDAQGRPVDYESVSSCGCYYKNFPSHHLEALAAETHAEKLKDKRFHIENAVDGKFDAVVPELVAEPQPGAPGSAWLYFNAGHHQLVTIRTARPAGDAGQVQAEREYRLLPYEALEHLPFNGYRASLFDPEGLVRQAHRPECSLLTPSGLYHAGHARQRETQMIYFDEAVFDDPQLLDTYLRLPLAALEGDRDGRDAQLSLTDRSP